MKRTQHKLLLFQIASYLLILLVPLLVINVLFAPRFLNIYRQELLSRVQDELDRAGASFEKEISLLRSTADEIRMTFVLSEMNPLKNPLKAQELIARLNACRITNPLIDTVVLYPLDGDFAFTNSTTSSKRLLLSSLLTSTALSPQSLRALFEKCRAPIPLPALYWQGRADYFGLLVPVYSNHSVHLGSCLFLISHATMQGYWQSQLGEQNISAFVLDADGELLLAYPAPGTALSALHQAEQTQQLHRNYMVLSSASEQYGWQYIALVPRRLPALARVGNVLRDLTLANLLALCASGILIFIFTKATYRPISLLKEKALRANAALPEPPPGHTELDFIAGTLDRLSSHSLRLTEQLESQRSILQSICLQQLLAGRYDSFAAFNKAAREYGISLSQPLWVVSLVQTSLSADKIEPLSAAVCSALAADMQCFCVFVPEPGRLLLLTGTSHFVRREYEQAMLRLHRQLTKAFSASVTIGIGNPVSQPSQLARSMMQSGAALDYSFVTGTNCILFYEDLPAAPTGQQPHYPHHAFQQLHHALSAGSDKEILHIVDDISTFLENSSLPLYTVKNICFELLSLLMHYQKTDKGLRCEIEDSLLSLAGTGTAQNVLALVHTLRMNLCKKPAPSAEGKQTQELVQQLFAYINQHCLRCDFSLQQMSEHFEMLLPNLSQFFKDKTGQNLLDYTTNLRMERAKRLLAETDLPLKELGYQVGYYNVSSFIRRFRQTQGITPGEFRKLHTQPPHTGHHS